MKKSVHFRLKVVFFSFAFGFLVIAARLVWLGVVQRERLAKIAEREHLSLVKLKARRGSIIDSRGNILAQDISVYSLYADPLLVKDKKEVAAKLSYLLKKDKAAIEKRLLSQNRFVWLKRRVSFEDKKKIEKLKIKGLAFLREEKRFHPQGNLLRPVLGSTDIDNNGIEGLELFYDKYLQAKDGQAVYLRDSRGHILPLLHQLVLPKNGYNLILTIDSYIQYWTEKFLQETVIKSRARGGAVVVLNPQTGAVLAMANFFPLNPQEGKRNISYRNHCVCDFYEPGSVFKVVTLLAALEKDKDIDKKEFFCENGRMKIPGSILHDWHSFGKLKFADVFKNSSNIGVAKIANNIGIDFVYRYIKKMGFGQKTGIDFPGETAGRLKPLARLSKTSYYIVPIGQGVGVSLLQLAVAFSAVANGGFVVRPHLAKEVVSSQGVVVKKVKPIRKGPIASSLAVEKAKWVLWQVVDKGTGRRAKIKGVKICGKTGTSQKISPYGGYSHTNFYASFVGFFPLSQPRFLIAVLVDEPRTYHYGGMIAAPLFKKIAEKIVAYKGLKLEDETKPAVKRN